MHGLGQNVWLGEHPPNHTLHRLQNRNVLSLQKGKCMEGEKKEVHPTLYVDILREAECFTAVEFVQTIRAVLSEVTHFIISDTLPM